jgi:hypothetical protein
MQGRPDVDWTDLTQSDIALAVDSRICNFKNTQTIILIFHPNLP